MTYDKLTPNTALTEHQYVNELDKAIACCDGYISGMAVVHIGTGYELQLNGDTVENNLAAPILSAAVKLVGIKRQIK